jgi:hypothetical protein
MMGAAGTSETSVNVYVYVFILTAVRTSNPTSVSFTPVFLNLSGTADPLSFVCAFCLFVVS